MTIGVFKPVNSILLGPIHTLHHPNGKLATETFWYEPFFIKQREVLNLEKNYAYIKRNESYVRTKIKRINYGEDIRKILIRYNDALDLNDHNSSLLHLWSILEVLTATTHARYDQTISRALFIYKDWDFQKQILEHLREVENITFELCS